MKDKISWFLKIWDNANPEIIGIGECGPLPGLSPEEGSGFENTLDDVVKNIERHKDLDASNLNLQHCREIIPPHFSSITFGMETALLDLTNGGNRIIFSNDFIRGVPIPINGLIWMGDADNMMRQIDHKIAQGFRCIKLKIGSLDFDQECRILHYIRSQYGKENITIRLDANGAFEAHEALSKLTALAKFNVHSIEQPIKKDLKEMGELCRNSPIPIAFDEELIGYETEFDKKNLLAELKPQFITLKPTLHGGLSGCQSWIEIAETLGIGWWITSALESNIGLNAICQFTANYNPRIPQGLGTGSIFQNNFDSPLKVENGNIFMNGPSGWSIALD